MAQRGLRSRAVAAVGLVMLCAGLLPGCAVLSRASETGTGVQADDNSLFPALSRDGHWLGFVSGASNLVAGDTNGVLDVFVRDNWTRSLIRVSVSSSGAQGNGTILDGVALSDDGRIVAFASMATNLVPGDANGTGDVFWHDRDTDRDGIFDESGATSTVLASARPDGAPGNGLSAFPDLNADGSVVAFMSYASDLLDAPETDTNAVTDVYAATFDVMTGQHAATRIVSRTPGSSVEGNGQSFAPSIDASGNVIAFETGADNLPAGDLNHFFHVVVNNGVRLFRGTGPVEGNDDTVGPALTRDGQWVAYLSRASNLVAGDTAFSDRDVFVTDFAGSGETWSPSAHPDDSHGGDADSVKLSISDDGRRVAFTSRDSGLVAIDTNEDFSDVFVHDRSSGVTQLVSTNVALQQGALWSDGGTALSGDGRFVAFATRSDVQRPDANGEDYDVFVRGAMVPVIDSVVAIDPVTRAEMPPVLHPGVNELLIAGGAFGEDVGVHLGAGITATITTARVRQLLVSVTVAPGTAAGSRNLVVHNPGTVGALAPGTFQICTACVTIAN